MTNSAFPSRAPVPHLHFGQDHSVYETDSVLPTQAEGPPHFLWTRRTSFFSSETSGKWCIVRSAEAIDALWEQVRQAVMAGRYPAALVSSREQAQTHGGTFVICLFTPDWQNREDVMAARAFLRELGVTEDIGYKRDIDTANNVYGVPEEWTYRA
jgi:hypothetical protein